MIALRLVRLIEDHSEEIAESLMRTFQSSSRTKDLSKVPAEELHARIREILQHLSEWLLTKTEIDIEKRYTELGARRAAQDVAVADLCWGFVMIKEQLWDFLARQGFLQGPLEIYGELELLRLLDQFFDRAICYSAEGYARVEAGRAA
ncbi:MAG TPA: hypothetical protein VFA89_16250 [Terriglobales bacterium]|nr:hypothetical protein [Terriglobales bacterium]